MPTTTRPSRIASLLGFSVLFCIWLATGIPAEAQGAPPAAAAPSAPEAGLRTDAFGEPIDTAAMVREQVSSQIAAGMGSAEWAPLGMKIIESHDKMFGRLLKTAEIDLRCMRRYRQENPEKTREEFRAFSQSAAGQQWQRACLLDLLNGPEVDPELADGLVASIEVGMMVPNFLNAIRQARERQGLSGAPEITPELTANLPEMANEGFAMSGCLMGEVLKKVPIGKVVTEPAKIAPIVQEVVQAGGCGFPGAQPQAPSKP